MWSAPPAEPPSLGTPAGTGAGDHDQPDRFGRRPRAAAQFPFSQRAYARLLQPLLCTS